MRNNNTNSNSKIRFPIMVGVLVFILLPLCFASLGTFKQNEEVSLTQTCNNCTYCNLTTIQYPNGSIDITNWEMTKDATFYNYSFNETSQLGTYDYCYDCGNLIENKVGCVNFDITPVGTPRMNSGEGFSLIGIVFLMVVIGVIFLIIAFRIENIAGKLGFFVFSTIIFIMAILFMVISAQQNLYGFSALVEGTETFWFVMKSLLTIGIIAFFVIVGLVMLKAWKIKRGYVDR